MGGDVACLHGGSLIHLVEDSGHLGPVVTDSFVLLLLQISEVGADGLGCEHLRVVLEEHIVASFPLGEVQEVEVP